MVTLHLAQIEVEDFYSCNDMFYQTSVTKHIVRWEKELTTLSLKDKGVEMNPNVNPKFNTNTDANRGKTESHAKPIINLPDNDINRDSSVNVFCFFFLVITLFLLFFFLCNVCSRKQIRK